MARLNAKWSTFGFSAKEWDAFWQGSLQPILVVENIAIGGDDTVGNERIQMREQEDEEMLTVILSYWLIENI